MYTHTLSLSLRSLFLYVYQYNIYIYIYIWAPGNPSGMRERLLCRHGAAQAKAAGHGLTIIIINNNYINNKHT